MRPVRVLKIDELPETNRKVRRDTAGAIGYVRPCALKNEIGCFRSRIHSYAIFTLTYYLIFHLISQVQKRNALWNKWSEKYRLTSDSEWDGVAQDTNMDGKYSL